MSSVMNSETKFTDGPWTVRDAVEPGVPGNFDVIGVPRFVIASTVAGLVDGEEEANARLISAAPDLYAVCRFALGVFKYNWCFDMDELLRDLEAALVKARGEG